MLTLTTAALPSSKVETAYQERSGEPDRLAVEAAAQGCSESRIVEVL